MKKFAFINRYEVSVLMLAIGFLIASVAVTYAINLIAEGFRLTGTAQKVDAYGACYNAKTTSGSDVFFPTKTSTEWGAFVAHKPSNVSLDACSDIYTYALDVSSWTNTGATLPNTLDWSQVAVIGDYVYLFGGFNSIASGYINSIYRAPVSNPTSWTKLTATLPSTIGASQLAIIGNYVYLFGGVSGGTPTKAIYRAPVSNPTSWTNTGATLPSNLANSQLAVIGDYVYLFGGSAGFTKYNVIYRAPVSNPTSWTNTGATLPDALEYSHVAVIGDYVYLFGGVTSSAYTNAIYRAPVSNPTSWTKLTATLPSTLVGSQPAVIGDYVYLFGGYNPSGYRNIIYRAPVSNPTSWTNTGATLPSTLGLPELAIIGDYVYLFGGYNNPPNTPVNTIYRARISSSINANATITTFGGMQTAKGWKYLGNKIVPR